MGILDQFEKGLERVVNGAFAKTFTSGLQPLEITSALRRELDTKAAVVSRDRILVPNRFRVHLSPSDHDRMLSLGPALLDEFTQLVQQHATAQRYTFAGGVDIALVRDQNLSTGIVRIESENAQGTVVWSPVVDINGVRHPLTRSRTILGRGSDADITLDDSGTSRKHVEILWDGARGQVNDLGSTNGTKLNGERITKAVLQPDSVIEVGRTRIVFRVVAQATDVASGAGIRQDGTR